MSETDNIKAALTKKKKERGLRSRDLLHTGSTLLNLACTDKPEGGFTKGRYFFIVGDSSSGKTFLGLTCLAEAAKNPHFNQYRFVYDNAEDGALMDIERFFGKEVTARLEPPAMEGGLPVFSSTIEEFYYHVDDALESDRPCIYILDSMDALSSEDEGSKFQVQKTAHRKGKEAAGSYGDGKAKKNAAGLRQLLPRLRETGSILIVLNQTRDNLGFGFEKKTRSGGHALRFYATLEIWLSVVEKLTKTVKGKKRQLGIISRVKIKKNRVTGKERSVQVCIYHSYGIDDIGSCIDYLIEEKHWKSQGGTIKAPEFDFSGTREQLVKLIEDENSEVDLRRIAGRVWNEIEDACGLSRKRRYE